MRVEVWDEEEAGLLVGMGLEVGGMIWFFRGVKRFVMFRFRLVRAARVVRVKMLVAGDFIIFSFESDSVFFFCFSFSSLSTILTTNLDGDAGSLSLPSPSSPSSSERIMVRLLPSPSPLSSLLLRCLCLCELPFPFPSSRWHRCFFRQLLISLPTSLSLEGTMGVLGLYRGGGRSRNRSCLDCCCSGVSEVWFCWCECR